MFRQMYHETFKLMTYLVTVLNIYIIILCHFTNKKYNFTFSKKEKYVKNTLSQILTTISNSRM